MFSQLATFEAGLRTPYPTGFDTIAGVTANLAVNAAAALRGLFGLQATVAAGGEAYGVLSGPNNQKSLTLEFLFDPNSMTMANGDNMLLARGPGSGTGGMAWDLQFRNNGNYGLRILIYNDAGGNTGGAINTISDAPHKVDLRWKASSAPGANDGFLELIVDGVLLERLGNIDNDGHDVDDIYIGAVAGVDAGSSGPIFLDDIGWSGQLR